MQPNPVQSLISNAITSPPTPFPQITVGGDPYEERFTLASSFFLETRCNIPAQNLHTWMNQQTANGAISSTMLILTASMLGRMVNGQWTPMPMLPEVFAAKCTEAEWTHIMTLYTDAMSKVAAAAKEMADKIRAKLAEQPPQTPPATEPIQ